MYKAYLLILFMLLFSFSGCFAQQYTQEEESPAVEAEAADPFTWDFGQVKEAEVLKHEFILKNDSTKPLNIKEVNTSCGCTVSEVKKKNLEPGESTLIEVKFDSTGYSGSVQQYIYVNTDSIENPVIRFTIKADVIK